jgi:ribosomal protein L11 methyltransferase
VPWLSITIELGRAEAEPLSDALLEAGAESVSLESAAAQPETIEADTPRMRLTALAPAGSDPALLVAAAAATASLAPPAFALAQVEDEDWVRRSQAQFGPIRVSDRLWIVPSWHTPPDENALVLRFDPGLAFGTGSHPSTRLVLRFLERTLDRGQSVLDYGCGSGILAIAAAKLGAGDIAAVDIDPQALSATLENAEANGTRLATSLPHEFHGAQFGRQFDVVLANILAGPLISLEPVLAGYARAGTRLALSGILESQAAEVAAAYAPHFSMRVSEMEEGWALVEGLRK